MANGTLIQESSPMNRVEVTIYLPDMLMYRMKALGITSPPTIVESILSWLDDEQMGTAIIESRVLTRCTACTRLRVRLSEQYIQRIRRQGNVELDVFIETVMSWVRDEHLHEAQMLLRQQLLSNHDIIEEALDWIVSEDYLDAPEIWEAMRGFSPQARREASAILVRIGAAAVPGLRTLLQDSRLSTRLSAIRTLGLIGSDKAINDLRPLLTDPDPLINQAASRALSKIGTPQALAWVDAWKRSNYKKQP